MMLATRVVVALLSLALTLGPPAVRAAEPVDLLLVLAADVSRSVTEPKFKLQREGAAAAITHPDVVKAITSGPNRRIAICFVEWATAGQQNVVIDWTLIGDAESARGFGGKLVELPRSFSGSTSISHAIDFSVAQLERAPFKAERRVIDVSGDGTNNSGRPVGDARDEALAKGITINGLVILTPLSEVVPPRAYQSAGWPGEVLPGQCHRRLRRFHRRRRKPWIVRPGAHQEADCGDRRTVPAAARRGAGQQLATIGCRRAE